MSSSLVLAGRLAVITGAGGGIGRAICNLFAREGCAIAAVDVNHQAADETVKGLLGLTSEVKHAAFQADVSSKQDVEVMMNSIFEEFKRPASIAINNAGITRDMMLSKMTEDAFDKVIAVNLKSVFLITQQFSKWMKEHEVAEGAIVNISSIVGKTGNVGQVNYAASKAGVVAITKSCAQELARKGIRCNAVLPGFIETEMTEKVPEHLQQLTKEFTPLKSFGQPEDVAEACLFLASSKSKFITGATLEVTGGLQM